MPTTTRDPRIDPQRGDIVRAANGKRERHVLGRGPTQVVYMTVTNERSHFSTEIYLDTWRAWCRKNKTTVEQQGQS